jgi:hypothetical protein
MFCYVIQTVEFKCEALRNRIQKAISRRLAGIFEGTTQQKTQNRYDSGTLLSMGDFRLSQRA